MCFLPFSPPFTQITTVKLSFTQKCVFFSAYYLAQCDLLKLYLTQARRKRHFLSILLLKHLVWPAFPPLLSHQNLHEVLLQLMLTPFSNRNLLFGGQISLPLCCPLPLQSSHAHFPPIEVSMDLKNQGDRCTCGCWSHVSSAGGGCSVTWQMRLRVCVCVCVCVCYQRADVYDLSVYQQITAVVM